MTETSRTEERGFASDAAERGVAGAAPDGARNRVAEALLAAVDRMRWLIFMLLACAYAAGFTGVWRIGSDASLYMSLGRNLARGLGYTYQGEAHNWVEPGLPLVIAAAFKICGEHGEWGVHIALLGFAAAGLVLAYHFFKRHADRPTAVLMVTLLALCENFYRFGFEVRTEMPFLCGVLLFLLGYEILRTPERSIGGGGGSRFGNLWGNVSPWFMMAIGMFTMIAFRPAAITFVGAAMLAVAWHLLFGPQRMKHALVGLLVIGCFLSFRLIDPRRADPEQPVYRESVLKELIARPNFVMTRAVTVFGPKIAEELLPGSVYSLEFGDGLDTVMTVVILGSGLMLFRRRVLWAAWIAATVGQTLIWWPNERYYLPILPLLLYGLWLLIRRIGSRREGWQPWAWYGFCTALLLVPNMIEISKFVRTQHREPFLKYHERGKYLPLMGIIQDSRGRIGENDVILADRHRQFSYLSGGLRAIELPKDKQGPPSAELVAAFEEKVRHAENVYVLLPAANRLRNNLKRLNVEIGPPIAASGGLTLNRARLVPPDATTSTTSPAATLPGEIGPGAYRTIDQITEQAEEPDDAEQENAQ